jgi:hypothetical protein
VIGLGIWSAFNLLLAFINENRLLAWLIPVDHPKKDSLGEHKQYVNTYLAGLPSIHYRDLVNLREREML